MTREKAREAAAVMQAYVDGEEVQYSPKQGKGSSFWTTTDKPLWNWEHYDYRIKPAKTMRPWTADEVPLGAWMRVKDSNCGHRRVLICGTYDELTRSTWLSTSEHSLDGGKTWHPCGVMEETK